MRIMTMRSRVISIGVVFAIAVCITNAAVVTYDFNSGLGASTSGGSLTAGDISYTLGSNDDGTPNSIERAWDQADVSGEYRLNIGHRGVGNSGITDANLEIVTTNAASYLSFVLTPNSGDDLDFSASELSADVSLYTDGNAFSMAYKVWADSGSGFVALDALQTVSMSAAVGTAGRLKQTDETTDLTGFLLTDGEVTNIEQQLTFDISALGKLATNQAVTIAISLSGNRNNQNKFANCIDNISLDLIVPESGPQAPVANDDFYDVDADSIFTNTAPGVLGNDSDANGDTLTAIQLTSPTNGTLTSFSTNGGFVYQPDIGFTGMDGFTYEVSDGGLTSEVATVMFTVNRDTTVANIFSDNMVLQRGLDIAVWGAANAGEEVVVSFAGRTNSVSADASGMWKAWFEPMNAGTNPAVLAVSSLHGSFSFTNLLVGDVWLCSGQSNMDRSLDISNPPVTNAALEIAAANYPEIRLMNVPTVYSTNKMSDFASQAVWDVCSSNSVNSFSATAYFFGRKVYRESGVPIGLIESAVGGTRIERWMPQDLRAEIGYTYDDRITELYNGMIHPLTGFPIKGAIWYQGESNAYESPEDIALYKDKLESMIVDWRDAWGVGEFPFYFAQICPHIRTDVLKLPTLWDAFTRTLSVPNTGLISLNDLNNYTNGVPDINEVHPSNKQDVGLRFGLMALEKSYGGVTNIAYTGPLFDSAVSTGSSVCVHFDLDTLGSGLASRDAQPLILFELAAADEIYFTNATAVITGNTVVVSHGSVAVPAYIRFGCNGNVPHNFMNAEGFPVNTFAAEVKTQSPPVAHPDLYEMSAGGSAMLDILANDTDVEGDALSASIVSNALHGTLVATNGMFLYSPTNGFLGTDRFTYRANDGTDYSRVVGVSVIVSEPAYPEVVLPSMLGSNMIFQRNHVIPIWGWGPAGETVTVTLSSGQTTNTVVDTEGRWKTYLPAMAATTNALTLVASTVGSSVTRTNILVGDVWLCVGQSNMGWRLNFTDGGPEEAAVADHPLLRHFYTSKYPTNTPLDNIIPETGGDPGIDGISATWTVCAPDVAKFYSAISYYFGRDLQQELNIPIGLIQSAYAGTAVEAWTKSVLPNAQPDSEIFIPAHQLFNGMIHPHLNTPISGVIWRQGDGNRRDGINYAEKVQIMVDEWRSLWGLGDFPFFYVQNPTVFDQEEDPTLPLFWEGQTEIMNVLSNSSMVIISDSTDGSSVHPRNKAPTGMRLAARVLNEYYGLSGIFASYPMFNSVTYEGSQMRVHFDGTGSGLAMGTNGTEVTWFEICESDGIFTNADAVIDGDTLLVSAAGITNPVGIRYLWSKYAIGNLFNVEGLPANSFRMYPPFAYADSYSVNTDAELYVEPSGIIGNDVSGSSRRPLQRPVLEDSVSNGTLMLRDDGAFIYEPATGFVGSDSFTYRVTDGTESSSRATVTLKVASPLEGSGQINRDAWTGIPGYLVSDLTGSTNYPDSPDESGYISSLDAPQNWGNDYGQRIYGYLHPPTNGNYTFYISSSARSEFWLSTDDSPSNLVKICSSLDRTVGDWTAAATPVSLAGGERYFIELLHKENSGSDHVQVAWDLAGAGTTNIVAGEYLSGIPVEVPDTSSYSSWSSWYGVSGDQYVIDFAFNLEPEFSDRDIMVPGTGTMGLPYWQFADEPGFSVEYLRRKDATGTTYAVQFTDDLLTSNWVASVTESVSNINATWERVIVMDDVNPTNAATRFGRVTITQE